MSFARQRSLTAHPGFAAKWLHAFLQTLPSQASPAAQSLTSVFSVHAPPRPAGVALS
jgi:hypothetical protein